MRWTQFLLGMLEKVGLSGQGMEVRSLGEVTILTPKGQLLGGEWTEELNRKIKELSENGNRKLLVNLGRTTHINRWAIAMLFFGPVARRGGMKVCAANKRIRSTLEAAMVSSVLDVFDTEDEAVASFK